MTEKTAFVMSAREITKDKKHFVACSAEINGQWYKIKFTRDCAGAPREKGLYKIWLNIDDCSYEPSRKMRREDGSEFTTNPTIWVKAIDRIQPFTEDELRERNRNQLADVFDNRDPLPF